MGAFSRELERLQPRDARGRRWVFVPYDQLTDAVGPLARGRPRELGVVLVEAPAKAARRPYHRQKLALVLANLRHFALEQASRGVAVRHVVSPAGYAEALAPLAAELGPLLVMDPAERELREELAPLVRAGALEVVPHEGWLTTEEDFRAAGGPPWRLDAFYRRVRRRTGLLMEGGRPAGGRWSHDAANRRPWRGDPPAPAPPAFPRDPIKDEVVALVARRFADHPGRLDPDALPATRADAEAAWAWARAACLPTFGPFEDAMSTASDGLFHTRLAALLNLHRLLPRRVVEEAAALPAPIESREGFVRQVLGWRELVRHVHRATDGLRRLPAPPRAPAAAEPLPPVFWGGAPSGLRCLDHVVDGVWATGWSHHITRLMVLGNLATLLGVAPRALSDWFWAAYVDAFDWVVEPNVLAMATFSVGDLMTTKPYVSGAAYLARMGDACRGCAFDPARTCPITPLYWAFLDRNQEVLAGNPRLSIPLAALRRRPAARRREDARVLGVMRAALAAGRRLRPADLTAS